MRLHFSEHEKLRHTQLAKANNKKEPQPIPARVSAEALRFCIKIDLYSDILGITDFDGKTYEVMLHLCSGGGKSAIFNL